MPVLSRKNSRWLGLILPIICPIFSIIPIFYISFSTVFTNELRETIDGVVISEEIKQINPDKPSLLDIILTSITAFLMLNIPTIILLAIYFAYREKLKVKSQLDRMNIQDLQ